MDSKEVLYPLLSGKELTDSLQTLPPYSKNIIIADASERLMALASLYKIYVPNTMGVEIYSKLYFALMHSIGKKNTVESVRQLNENRKQVKGAIAEGIIGGADSFSVIGPSGIGKSTSINRAVELIIRNNVMEIDGCKLIPCIVVQTPFDSYCFAQTHSLGTNSFFLLLLYHFSKIHKLCRINEHLCNPTKKLIHLLLQSRHLAHTNFPYVPPLFSFKIKMSILAIDFVAVHTCLGQVHTGPSSRPGQCVIGHDFSPQVLRLGIFSITRLSFSSINGYSCFLNFLLHC